MYSNTASIRNRIGRLQLCMDIFRHCFESKKKREREKKATTSCHLFVWYSVHQRSSAKYFVNEMHELSVCTGKEERMKGGTDR